MFFITNVLHKCFTSEHKQNTRFDPKTLLEGNITLSTDIPSHNEKQGLFFQFIVYTKSKKEKN
jgi:hypothetical protein